MDGIKLKEDFEKFLSRHPEAIIRRGGCRLFITKKLSTFCYEYGYPLEPTRKLLKKLGIPSGRKVSAWDPHEKVNVYCRVLEDNQVFQVNDLIEETKRIIEQSPKIVWRKCMWIRKQHLLPLCEKYEISYNVLLRILRKHGLISTARKIYDAEATEPVLAVAILHNDWEKQIVEKAEWLLRDKALKGKFVAQKDLLHLAQNLGIEYKALVNPLRENGIIGEYMIVVELLK